MDRIRILVAAPRLLRSLVKEALAAHDDEVTVVREMDGACRFIEAIKLSRAEFAIVGVGASAAAQRPDSLMLLFLRDDGDGGWLYELSARQTLNGLSGEKLIGAIREARS